MPLYESDKNLWNTFERYSAGSNTQYDQNLPITVGGKKCDGLTDNLIDYTQTCYFDDNYDAFISSVKNYMTIPEGIIVKPRTRLAYFTNKQHMLSNGIPAWSKSPRPLDQMYVSNLMNKSVQCSYGSKFLSICSTDIIGGNDYWPFIPWLGGAFAVLEKDPQYTGGGCDTTLLDNGASILDPVVIDTQCQTDACTIGGEKGYAPLYEAQVCKARQGQLPQQSVPVNHPHHMCNQKLKPNPGSCFHPQGMLYGLQVRVDETHFLKGSEGTELLIRKFHMSII